MSARGGQAYTGDPETDRLLFRWPAVIRSTTGRWRGFALGIQRDRKKPGWMPSPRQIAAMRRLVAELPVSGGNDPKLIEGES